MTHSHSELQVLSNTTEQQKRVFFKTTGRQCLSGNALHHAGAGETGDNNECPLPDLFALGDCPA